MTWDGEANLAGSRICIASDDPGRPTLQVSLLGEREGEGRLIGQTAPEFGLEDLDGDVHRLSEQRGRPVVLAYFTTW